MLAGFSHDIDLADRVLTVEDPIRIRYLNGDLQSLPWQFITVQGPSVDFLASRLIDPTAAEEATPQPTVRRP